MAFRHRKFLSLLNRGKRYLPSTFCSISGHPFTSIVSSESPSDPQKLPFDLPFCTRRLARLDERFVLQELSEILTIDAKTPGLPHVPGSSAEIGSWFADRRPVGNDCSAYQRIFGNYSQREAEGSNYDNVTASPSEKCVQSSSLLMTSSMYSIHDQFIKETARSFPDGIKADGFLSPAEKLRGIFLQKLKGKANIKAALSATGVDLTQNIVAEVVKRGNLGGEAMVTFFDWAVEQPKIAKDLEIYHIILKALGRRKFFDFVEAILQRMKKEGLSINGDTLLIVMDSYVRARRISKAFEMFERVEEFGLKCDCESFNLLLKCLCRRSHVGIANSFLNAMRGKIHFNRNTYVEVISGWSKLGRVNEVEKNWQAMLSDGLQPDCLTFSHVIEALGRAGQIDSAVDVFNKMGEKGCIPDTVVFNAMICNFISVGDLNKCLKYYEDMMQKNCLPNIDTYTTLINAFIKFRRVADALETFDDMLDRGIHPSVGTITSFIEPLCRFGPPYAALMIYKKARKVGCGVSLKAYKLLLKRLSRFGKCGIVLKVWEDMQDNGYTSDVETYECIINGLCNIGQLGNALHVMEEALDKGFCPSKVIYSKLNNKLLNVNKVEIAYKLSLKVKKVRFNENAKRYWRSNGWHF